MSDRIPEQEREEAIATLREAIRDIPVAMMTTVSEDGQLASRPMVNVNDSFDGTLWFFTNQNDPKTDSIVDHPQINVAFSRPDRNRFVSISGRAEIVDDPKRKELLWNRDCEPWFENGSADSDVCLIRVDVEMAAYWDRANDATAVMTDLLQNLMTGETSQEYEHQQLGWSSQDTEVS